MEDIVFNFRMKRLKKKREELARVNMNLLTQGKNIEYQFNCNYLSGLQFAIDVMLKR